MPLCFWKGSEEEWVEREVKPYIAHSVCITILLPPFNRNLNLIMTRLRHLCVSCMYFHLPNITVPMYIQYLGEAVSLPIQNLVAIYKQTTAVICYQISSSLVTLFKFIYASTYVPDVLIPTFYCMLTHFVFPSLILEMPSYFMSNTVQIISTYFSWIL